MNEDATYPRKWEPVTANTYRMATPEGWIVKDIYTFVCADKHCSVAMGTWKIADPNHDKWKLD